MSFQLILILIVLVAFLMMGFVIWILTKQKKSLKENLKDLENEVLVFKNKEMFRSQGDNIKKEVLNNANQDKKNVAGQANPTDKFDAANDVLRNSPGGTSNNSRDTED